MPNNTVQDIAPISYRGLWSTISEMRLAILYELTQTKLSFEGYENGRFILAKGKLVQSDFSKGNFGGLLTQNIARW